MITVHHLNDSRSQRILWLLEELALGAEMKGKTEGERGGKGERPREEDQSPAEGDPPLHGAFSERTYPTPRIVWMSLAWDVSSTFPRR